MGMDEKGYATGGYVKARPLPVHDDGYVMPDDREVVTPLANLPMVRVHIDPKAVADAVLKGLNQALKAR